MISSGPHARAALMAWGTALLVSTPAPAQPTPTGSVSPADEPVLRLIRRIRQAAPAITIDGRSDDWGPVPLIPDDTADEPGDPSRNISGVAVLPLDEALLVRIETTGPPSRDDRAFWLDLDLTGTRTAELQLGLSPDGRHFLRRFDAAGNPRGIRRMRLPWAVGRVVEVALPFEALEEVLPNVGPLRGAGARSWVRVVAVTWDRGSGAFRDFASAASYRIVPDPGALDPPLPWEPPGPTAVLDFPLADRWLVSQGPFGPESHAGTWAYDLALSDQGLRWSRTEGTCDNEDFWGWNSPVQAPGRGEVLLAVGDEPDGLPCGRPREGGGNEVHLDLGVDVGVRLAHLRLGSVAVRRGESVAPGQTLGRVGNSGRSTGPHLHLSAFRPSDGRVTLPIAFRNVRVGLNPVPGDPWARSLAVWEPRDGFFVEASGR
jgi:hypothetical protein